MKNITPDSVALLEQGRSGPPAHLLAQMLHWRKNGACLRAFLDRAAPVWAGGGRGAATTVCQRQPLAR